MALTATGITSAIVAAGPDLRGPTWYELAALVGIAVATWARIPSNLVMQGVTTGVAGAGTVFGKFSVVPSPLPLSMAAVKLLGPTAPDVARAIGMGVSAAFNSSAAYRGVSAGVGVGADVSKVTAVNGPFLVNAIATTASSRGMVGPTMPQLAAGLGTGIATLLATGIGIGTVTGGAGPVPAVGTSISQVV